MNWATCSVACTVWTTSSTPSTRWRRGARSVTAAGRPAGLASGALAETMVPTVRRTIGTGVNTCQTVLPVSTRVTKADVVAGLAQPAGREAAPGGLRLVQAFINTMNHEFEEADDRLRTPREAARWLLRERVIHGRRLPDDIWRDLRDLRELLRALAVANLGG